jgi:hypothetical protein
MRLAALTLLLAASLSAAASASEQYLPCPTEVRATPQLVGSQTDGWIATPQTSRVVSLGIETFGGQPALVCRYAMFGSVYSVWRRPPEGRSNCAVHPEGFRCHP